jgi:hypothetical protein
MPLKKSSEKTESIGTRMLEILLLIIAVVACSMIIYYVFFTFIYIDVAAYTVGVTALGIIIVACMWWKLT